MCDQQQDAFLPSYFWYRAFQHVMLPLTTSSRGSHEAEAGSTKWLPGPWPGAPLTAAGHQARRRCCLGPSGWCHPTARSPPQPIFLRPPQPRTTKQGFPSAPHSTEACPFSRAQPERGPGGILRRSVK